MVTGLNHITLAVTNLDRSFDSYSRVLGCKPFARWERGAYLTAGGAWVAIVVDETARSTQRPGYSHIAFSCAQRDFSALIAALSAEGCSSWSKNTSEGDSYYFMDPDGHQLEIHVGDLDTRLEAMKRRPWDGIRFFDD